MPIVKAPYTEGQVNPSARDLPDNPERHAVFPDTDGVRSLSAEQRELVAFQTTTGFAQTVLAHPAEDCWNDV